MLTAVGRQTDFLKGAPTISTTVGSQAQDDNNISVGPPPAQASQTVQATSCAQFVSSLPSEYSDDTTLDSDAASRMRKIWFHHRYSQLEEIANRDIEKEIKDGSIKLIGTGSSSRRSLLSDRVMKMILGQPSKRPVTDKDKTARTSHDAVIKRLRRLRITGRRWAELADYLGSDSGILISLDPTSWKAELEKRREEFWSQLMELLPTLAPHAIDMARALHQSRAVWASDKRSPPLLVALDPRDELMEKLKKDECSVEERISLLTTVDY